MRQIISDFAVIIAILAMSGIDFAVGIHTPKLEVPSELKPTWEGRGWLIPPFNGKFISGLFPCVYLQCDQYERLVAQHLGSRTLRITYFMREITFQSDPLSKLVLFCIFLYQNITNRHNIQI